MPPIPERPITVSINRDGSTSVSYQESPFLLYSSGNYFITQRDGNGPTTLDVDGNGSVDRYRAEGSQTWQPFSGMPSSHRKPADETHAEKVNAGWRLYADFSTALAKDGISKLQVLTPEQRNDSLPVAWGHFTDREGRDIQFGLFRDANGRITKMTLTSNDGLYTVQLDRQQIVKILPTLEEMVPDIALSNTTFRSLESLKDPLGEEYVEFPFLSRS